MTLTAPEIELIDLPDASTPCDCDWHRLDGTEPGPIAWIIFVRPAECGCWPALTVLWCTGCKDRILTIDTMDCQACGHIYRASSTIERIEAI